MRAREHAAVSDCERVRPGLIGQPANAASSLAFVVAAVPIWRLARSPRSGAWKLVAAALAFEGIGSVAYHGPGGRISKAIHDIGIVGLAAAFAAVLRDEPRSAKPSPIAATLGAGAAALHAFSRTGGPLCSCNSAVQGHAIFHLLAAAATVAAAKRR
ncbi:MAG: hypothetical protein H0U92_03650 [Actinobacteria bacterium]|nr:hypothetical protein [Actinomycetota bacterium]